MIFQERNFYSRNLPTKSISLFQGRQLRIYQYHQNICIQYALLMEPKPIIGQRTLASSEKGSEITSPHGKTAAEETLFVFTYTFSREMQMENDSPLVQCIVFCQMQWVVKTLKGLINYANDEMKVFFSSEELGQIERKCGKFSTTCRVKFYRNNIYKLKRWIEKMFTSDFILKTIDNRHSFEHNTPNIKYRNV